jgi:putative endonuclease
VNYKNKKIGCIGETAAAAYLLTLGFFIHCKNYRAGRSEIDLIVSKKNTLVFVEVKTRSSELSGYPEEAVNYKKEANIRKASGLYGGEIRYDIIAIILDKKLKVKGIFHIEDAFFAGPG